MNSDLSQVNTLVQRLAWSYPLLPSLGGTYNTAVSPACLCVSQLLGTRFTICIAYSYSPCHSSAGLVLPQSTARTSFWMIILMSTHFNDHSLQPLTTNLLPPILLYVAFTTPLSIKLLMDLDEINPLTSSSTCLV